VKRCHNARADFSCHVCSRRAEEKKRDNELHDERGRRRRVRTIYQETKTPGRRGEM